jgi:hypothetical protein
VAGAKVATTLFAAVIDTLQVAPLELVHPLQDQNFDAGSRASALRVAVTDGVAFTMLAVQAPVLGVEQSMSPPVTRPRPLPAVRTVRSQVDGWNAAVTDFASVPIVKLQVFPEEVVQPVQDFRIAPAAGAAVRTTGPAGTSAVQVAGATQSPPGPETTLAALPVARMVSVAADAANGVETMTTPSASSADVQVRDM